MNFFFARNPPLLLLCTMEILDDEGKPVFVPAHTQQPLQEQMVVEWHYFYWDCLVSFHGTISSRFEDVWTQFRAKHPSMSWLHSAHARAVLAATALPKPYI